MRRVTSWSMGSPRCCNTISLSSAFSTKIFKALKHTRHKARVNNINNSRVYHNNPPLCVITTIIMLMTVRLFDCTNTTLSTQPCDPWLRLWLRGYGYGERGLCRELTMYMCSIFFRQLAMVTQLNMSLFANCRSQFLLDRLGRCLKLIVSSESISCHEFASQLGLEYVLYAKKPQTYR